MLATEYIGIWSTLRPKLCQNKHLRCSKDSYTEHSCSICLQLFLNPCQITLCGHVFCKDCITSTKPKKCPLCRQGFEASHIFPDKKTENSLFNLQASCPNSPNHFKGSIRELIRHLKSECPLEAISCICAASVRRQDKPKHDKEECPKRKVECPLCTKKVQFDTLNAHDCKYVICSLCSMKMLRIEKESHERNTCPEAVICCTVRGCPEKVPRKSMEQHVSSSILKHLVCTNEYIQTLEAKIDKIEQEKSFFYNESNLWLGGWTSAIRDLPDLEELPEELKSNIKYISRFVFELNFRGHIINGKYLKKINPKGVISDHSGNFSGYFFCGCVSFPDNNGYEWDLKFDGYNNMIGTWQQGEKKGIIYLRRLHNGFPNIPDPGLLLDDSAILKSVKDNPWGINE